MAPFKPIISVIKGPSSPPAEDEIPKMKKSSKPVFIRKSPMKQVTAAVVSEASVETVVPLANGVVMHVVEIDQEEKREESPTAIEKTRLAPVFRPYPAINRPPFEHYRKPATVRTSTTTESTTTMSTTSTTIRSTTSAASTTTASTTDASVGPVITATVTEIGHRQKEQQPLPRFMDKYYGEGWNSRDVKSEATKNSRGNARSAMQLPDFLRFAVPMPTKQAAKMEERMDTGYAKAMYFKN